MNVFTNGQYDKWATGGRYSRDPSVIVFCHNQACKEYGEVQEASYEKEYGAGWYTPEECPTCGGEWHEHAPEDVDVRIDGRRL